MPASVAILGLIALALIWVLWTDRKTRPGNPGPLPTEDYEIDLTAIQWDWWRERDHV